MKNKIYFSPVVLGGLVPEPDDPLPGGSTGHGGDPIFDDPNENPLDPGNGGNEGGGDDIGGGSGEI